MMNHTLYKPRDGGKGNKLQLISADIQENTATVEVQRGMFCPNETITISLDRLLTNYELDRCDCRECRNA